MLSRRLRKVPPSRYGYLLLLISALLIELSILNLFRIGNFKPDLLLILVVYFALRRGARFGAEVGIVAGLLKDMASGAFFGTHAAAFWLCGLLVGRERSKIYEDQFLAQIIVVALSSLFVSAVYFITRRLFSPNDVSGTFPAYLPVLLSVYTSLIAPFLFKFLDKAGFSWRTRV